MTCDTDFTPERIRNIRSKLRLTQEDFAHKIGVTFSTVNRWESGKSKPHRVNLNIIRAYEKRAQAL